ncbi:MAG TPA: hypothetical protein VGR54_02340 [Nitrosopumilaceae archaeon]|nr:hypothetical protein [Nitrosopumilaceae archaeon]
MEKKQDSENKTKRHDNRRPFLGLPTAVWMSSDLYIMFVNPTKS